MNYKIEISKTNNTVNGNACYSASTKFNEETILSLGNSPEEAENNLIEKLKRKIFDHNFEPYIKNVEL